MADGQGRERWAHTSLLCALIANAHRGPRTRAFKPADFDPYARVVQEMEADELTLAQMRRLFTGDSRKE